MSSFRDPFPNLSPIIDVGGDRYFMGSEKPVELGFKSRADYINSYGTDPKTEYLLRKYMFVSLKDKGKLRFNVNSEKADLIKTLKSRVKKLESSQEFTSSILKNVIIKRSIIGINKIIQELEGAAPGDENSNSGFKWPSLPDFSTCSKNKKYIRGLDENKLFQIMLEISWYLLHPDEVPKNIQCDWAKLVKQLDTLRLGDIVGQIKEEQEKQGGLTEEKPLNYFKRINLERVAKAPTRQNALDDAKAMAVEVQSKNTNDDMKTRLKTVLNILELRRYLNKDLPVNKDRLKIIDVPAAEKIEKALITNPLKGGSADGDTIFDKSLGVAMEPFFEYFRILFDPIYTMLEDTYKNALLTPEITEKIFIPPMLTLLHLCNNLNPSPTTESGRNTYGMYRIRNVDSSLLKYITLMISSTIDYVGSLNDDKDKFLFNKQIFKLPNTRLTSLLDKNTIDISKDEDIPFIQMFVLTKNISHMSKIELEQKGITGDEHDSIRTALDEYFTDSDLYILCTRNENMVADIPMKLYEIDFGSVDVENKTLEINHLDDNYFNKDDASKKEYYLENLMSIEPYVVYNDAELAMSILIAMKERMPK